jgi:seryl-tRNA synthetase
LHGLRREHENARTEIASLKQELARRVEELAHTGQESHRAKLAAETSLLDSEHAREELAHAKQKLRRAQLAAEASSIDIARARAELRAMLARCRSLIAQFGQITSQEVPLSQIDSQQTSPDQSGSRETSSSQIDSQQILSEISEQLRQVHNSTSWRITRPMRALKRPRRTLRILLRGLAN